MAYLNQEIWLPELLEDFVPDNTFLYQARDMSAFVDYDKVNLAEAGVNPKVLINNTTYPIPVSQREDIPISLELDTYDTENTLIRNIELAELAYDKRTSILYGHRQAIRMEFMEKAIHAYAPSSDGEFTPVIPTSGDNDGNGVKELRFEDILTLRRRFNGAEIPSEGRILVLCEEHEADLQKQNLSLYKDIFNDGKTYGGFKIYTLATKRMPVFNRNSGAKKPFGASRANTDTYGSVAFQKDEVMRAVGEAEMFVRENDPAQLGSMMNFLLRFKALPIRNKGIGAVYSAAV